MSDSRWKDDVKAEFKDRVKADAKQRAKAFGTQIKQVVKAMSPEQRDALMQRLLDAAQKAPGHDAPELQPGGDDAERPLSFAQEREWFRSRMFPGVAHNISGALVCEGQLSMPALQAAFDDILRRHDALRATFRAPEGTPLQTFSDRPASHSDQSLRLAPPARDAEVARRCMPRDRAARSISRATFSCGRLSPASGRPRVMLLITMHRIVPTAGRSAWHSRAVRATGRVSTHGGASAGASARSAPITRGGSGSAWRAALEAGLARQASPGRPAADARAVRRCVFR